VSKIDIFELKAYEIQLKKIFPTLVAFEFSIKPGMRLSTVTFSFVSASSQILFHSFFFLSKGSFLSKAKIIEPDLNDQFNNLIFDSESYKRFFSQQIKDKIILNFGVHRDFDESEALWSKKRTELMNAKSIEEAFAVLNSELPAKQGPVCN